MQLYSKTFSKFYLVVLKIAALGKGFFKYKKK
jgi:hypothetical protein